MGRSSKRMKKAQKSDTSSEDDDIIPHQPQNDNHTNGHEDHSDEEEYDSEMEMMNMEDDEDVSGNEDSDSMEENGDDDDDDDDDENESDEEDADDDDMDTKIEDNNHADMEELQKEYNDLQQQEQDLFRNIRHDQNEDLQKGEAVKNQMALWDKTLEFRFLLQKSFSNSNRLPQEPIRSAFCNSDEGVTEAYSDVINSTKKTLDSILKLQEALIEKNPSIEEAQNSTSVDASDEEWSKISKMQSRIALFRDMSVDKWQRKTQVTSGAAGIKNKFQAFNQNISEQVAFYMRDPSRMIKGMQQRRSVVPVFGNVSDSTLDKDEVINADGDPELLDDSEFYQQLLREFFETFNPESSETAFYALKRLQTKKRKIVDRRASKSRKIRYHIHEKIVNFMAPQPMNIPPMASKLFENLFGLKTDKLAQLS